ncbi:MAG: ABC-F family ATP-binding cassette domain-containing protein, partial [Clostridia bacterium]|nr:ABC-F family ATP-binding cassette domain-containing protein [Clostridia bacterium]
SIRFHFTAREPGGNDVLMGENLKKSYGEKHLFHDVDLLIKKNERVFLLGPNGCGKTTLLRILTGRKEPDAGTHRLGAKVQPAYYDQNISQMDPENTALQEVWDAYPRMRHTEVRSALATFLFKGDEVEKKIATLSGGEKARIQLLKMMLSGANLLLLDEPTNHLDIHSREALENALEDYGGTMLVVTHDRYLVNRLADRILAMEPDGLAEYIGGYDDYLEEKARRKVQEEAATPVKPQKAQNDYRAQKERQSALNRARGEVRRTEEQVARAEEELASIEEKLASPAVASDYVKASELAKAADTQREQLDKLYEKWERAQEALEELESEE